MSSPSETDRRSPENHARLRTPAGWIVVVVLSLVGAALVFWAIHTARLRLSRNRGEPGSVPVKDWPMWRHEANRSAVTPLELARELHVQWIREYPPLTMAWQDPINQDRMPFDKVYEPVVSGHRMFLGFNASDKVVALDTRTGRAEWTFYADGPVRFPPAVWNDRIFFVSDDGYLYCVAAKDGSLMWRFRGGPADRRILGNERLISMWPARGGPVVADGVVYFAASIWPFMGVFIHALDAADGHQIWSNTGSGATFMLQPHSSPAFAGVAPQGSLAVLGDNLLVPGGRSVPACFDRRDGALRYYRLADNGKRGGSQVAASGNHILNTRGLGTDLYDLATGDLIITNIGNSPVLTENEYYFSGNPVVAIDPHSFEQVEYTREIRDSRTRRLRTVTRRRWVAGLTWECAVDGTGDLIRAGSRLYAGGAGSVTAIDIPKAGRSPSVSWSARIQGTASRIVAADDRLFVVTLDGKIYCFGPEKRPQPTNYPCYVTTVPATGQAAAAAGRILDAAGVRDGYCLAYGVTEADVVEQLARQSSLKIDAFCPDREQIDAMRRRLDDTGLYGNRIAVHEGDPTTAATPPYMASFTLISKVDPARIGKIVPEVFGSIRPYGGIACFAVGAGERERVARAIDELALPNARVRDEGDFLLLSREGPLAGSASWTHMYGDVANTVKSDDRLVKAPLGLLWFGGSSHMDVLPRHGHGPPEQVIGGRLFIEGMDCLSARDVYTGRVLWKRTLRGLNTFGVYHDETQSLDPLDTSYSQVHIPGANARGTNFVATEDAVYIIQGKRCLRLDPETGRTLGSFTLPKSPDRTRRLDWAYIGVYKDLLIAGADFFNYTHEYRLQDRGTWLDFDRTSSKALLAMDRHTGEIKWSFKSRYGLRHSAIAIGNDRVFCIDMMPPAVRMMLESAADAALAEDSPDAPAGKPVASWIAPPPTDPARILALDVRTGDVVWDNTTDVFGTWLGYSEEHDVLLQGGRSSRDMLFGEPSDRMMVLRAADGSVLWDDGPVYSGPCMLHGDTIITQSQAFDLLTGEPRMRLHPLTGDEVSWGYERHYGCNTVICSEHLLTFRSAAAGFVSLDHAAGTANIGGFKSGCTSNLVVADGVLNAPDYTRTCTCSYQNQTSLALIHMPENDMWSFSELPSPQDRRIRFIGLNLGAPGDRFADDGVLWLDYPSVGGQSPSVHVFMQPAEPDTFRIHPMEVSGEGLNWVGASGCRGIRSLEVTLAPEYMQDDPATYTIRLHFADPDNSRPGRRVFDVALQGRTVLRDLDVAAEAKGRRALLVKDFHGIRVGDRLTVRLTPGSPGAKGPAAAPILCGLEIRQEK